MAVLPKVRSALCAASQLPGEGPFDVEDALAPVCKSKPDDDDDDDDNQYVFYLRKERKKCSKFLNIYRTIFDLINAHAPISTY